MTIHDLFNQDLEWSRLTYMKNMAFNSQEWIRMVETSLGIQIEPDIVVSDSGRRFDFTWHKAIDALNAAIKKREDQIRKDSAEHFRKLCDAYKKESDSKYIH